LKASVANELIDGCGCWTKGLDNTAAVIIVGRRDGGQVGWLLEDRYGLRATEQRDHRLCDVLNTGHEDGAILQEVVRAARARIERRARNGEDETAHFVGKACADQRARAFGRFHDQ